MRQAHLTKQERRALERRRGQEQWRRRNQVRRLVPLIAAAAVFVLAIGAVMWAQVRPTITGTARLFVSQTQLDLGQQKYNTQVRAAFQIRNDGDGTLILNVPDRPTVLEGCCPDRIVVGQTRLQPGETTELYTDLMMHEGMGGKHLFEIVLNTNDKTRPTEKLYIASDWVP